MTPEAAIRNEASAARSVTPDDEPSGRLEETARPELEHGIAITEAAAVAMRQIPPEMIPFAAAVASPSPATRGGARSRDGQFARSSGMTQLIRRRIGPTYGR